MIPKDSGKQSRFSYKGLATSKIILDGKENKKFYQRNQVAQTLNSHFVNITRH